MNAELHIQTMLRNRTTVLQKGYATPPFRIADITENKQEPTLHLMLMNSSPGILDGDEYRLRIDMEAGTRMQLHTQSYQRLFNMQQGAKQIMDLHLQNGASLVYLPHPAVPHEQSSFTAINTVYLAEDCRLVWGEILTCGRKLNGEIFRLSKYHNRTNIFLNGKIAIRENLLIEPKRFSPGRMGQLEGFTHQASFIYLDNEAETITISDKVHAFLSEQQGIEFGVTAAPANGIIVRLHGHKAEQLHEYLKAITQLLATQKKKEVLHAG